MTRVATLDGLRALAVLLVVASHSFAGLPLGGVGVMVFFVLSGYLITTLLLRECDATGQISLGLFYLRRAARLYPALGVMLLVTVAIGAPLTSALIAATYITNLVNSFGVGNFPYGHTWSLAMEEQFYLLWPLVLPTLFRLGRRSWTLLAVTALASAGAGWLFGALTGGGAGVAAINPVLRAQGPIVGCLLAFHLHRRVTPVRRPDLVIGAGLAVLGGSVIVGLIGTGRPAAFGWNSIPPVVGGALLIAGLLTGGITLLGRMFGSRPAVWIGTRSYALYLWHSPLIGLGLHRGWSLPTAALIGVPASVVLSDISYRWVEKPFLRLKDRLHPGSRPSGAPGVDHPTPSPTTHYATAP